MLSRAHLIGVAVAAGFIPGIASAQEISVEPDTVKPGGDVQITGSCGTEAESQSIQIVFGGGIEGGQLARVETAAGSGAFGATVTIPEDSPRGDGRVAAACGLGSSRDPSTSLTIATATDQAAESQETRVSAGDTGLLVSFWQDRLNEWIALSGADFSPLTVDGIFGPNTEAATRLFQQSIDTLGLDGIVDPIDRVALREEIERLEAASADDQISPVGDFTEPPVEAEDFPARGTPELLNAVDIGLHAGFTRVVFEFGSRDDLSYRVRNVDEVRGPSGQTIEVAGEALLEVTMSPASGVDLEGDGPVQSYTGPERLAPAGADALVEEVVLVEDFEGMLTWVIGVADEPRIATALLTDPLRLVIDIGPS